MSAKDQRPGQAGAITCRLSRAYESKEGRSSGGPVIGIQKLKIGAPYAQLHRWKKQQPGRSGDQRKPLLFFPPVAMMKRPMASVVPKRVNVSDPRGAGC